MKIANLTKYTYAKNDDWREFFKYKSINDIIYDPSWTLLFATIKNDKKFDKKFDKIDAVLKNKIKNNIKIYPLPKYVFSAFLITPADNVKVVFLGQDPYINNEFIDNKYVPQAMGLSFSVPHGTAIPPSLNNIYSNLLKFGHIKKRPISGNLWYWAEQGCLMLNAALTVEHKTPKSHSDLWEWMTDYVIKYISKYMNNIIFVMWGGDAYKKISLIDLNRHHTIISSHPSPLSVNKKFKKYPAFIDEDHFGKINLILRKNGQREILWD